MKDWNPFSRVPFKIDQSVTQVSSFLVTFAYFFFGMFRIFFFFFPPSFSFPSVEVSYRYNSLSKRKNHLLLVNRRFRNSSIHDETTREKISADNITHNIKCRHIKLHFSSEYDKKMNRMTIDHYFSIPKKKIKILKYRSSKISTQFFQKCNKSGGEGWGVGPTVEADVDERIHKFACPAAPRQICYDDLDDSFPPRSRSLDP